MEDYLRQFRLGPCTQEPGLAGLRQRRRRAGPGVGPGSRTARTASARRNGTRSGSGWRRASPAVRGRAPRGWQRWAEEAFHPPQPWRELLGAAVRSAASGPGAGEDYTYGRPSRRSAGVPGVVLPSLRRRPPRVSVVIDTSGSVSDAELGSALLEVAAISRAVGGRRDLVSVLPCDAAARSRAPAVPSRGDPAGGRRRHGPARGLRQGARGHGPGPTSSWSLTDGQTPWPGTRPPCRTVVGLFPRGRSGRSWDEDNPTTCRTRRPTGPEWSRSDRLRRRLAEPQVAVSEPRLCVVSGSRRRGVEGRRAVFGTGRECATAGRGRSRHGG